MVVPAVSNNRAVELGEHYLRAAFGLEDPEEQLVGSFLLGVAIIAASPLSGGAKLVLLPIPIFLFFVGVARIVWRSIRG